MGKRIQRTLIVIFVFSSALTLFFIATKRDKKIFAIDYLKNGVNVKIDNAYLVQDKNNTKEWELHTDSAEVYRADDVMALKNVKMDIYPEKGTVFTIYAETGKIKNKEKDLEVSGNVMVDNKDYTLRTQSLSWFSSKKEVRTDDYVEVKGEKFTISGVGLVIDVTSKTLRITDKVHAVFDI